MRFVLIDRILEVVPGERLVAVKHVSLAEEYLQDHFPRFAVLPGVLMLEGLVQAAAWLVRVTEGFAHSLVVLQQARNVVYKSFVRPGQELRLEVAARRIDPGDSEFTGAGWCGGTQVVRAHMYLVHRNVADERPGAEAVDQRLIETARAQWELLGGVRALAGGSAPAAVASMEDDDATKP